MAAQRACRPARSRASARPPRWCRSSTTSSTRARIFAAEIGVGRHDRDHVDGAVERRVFGSLSEHLERVASGAARSACRRFRRATARARVGVGPRVATEEVAVEARPRRRRRRSPRRGATARRAPRAASGDFSSFGPHSSLKAPCTSTTRAIPPCSSRRRRSPVHDGSHTGDHVGPFRLALASGEAPRPPQAVGLVDARLRSMRACSYCAQRSAASALMGNSATGATSAHRSAASGLSRAVAGSGRVAGTSVDTVDSSYAEKARTPSAAATATATAPLASSRPVERSGRTSGTVGSDGKVSALVLVMRRSSHGPVSGRVRGGISAVSGGLTAGRRHRTLPPCRWDSSGRWRSIRRTESSAPETGWCSRSWPCTRARWSAPSGSPTRCGATIPRQSAAQGRAGLRRAAPQGPRRRRRSRPGAPATDWCSGPATSSTCTSSSASSAGPASSSPCERRTGPSGPPRRRSPLWRGRPFDDVEGWEPARIEAARLDELRHEAEELHVDAALRAGRHHEVLATARALVDAAPTRERRWELLALAQYRSGSQADALRTLHEARRRLADGARPRPRARHRRARVGDPPPRRRPASARRSPRSSTARARGPASWPTRPSDAEEFAGRAAESRGLPRPPGRATASSSSSAHRAAASRRSSGPASRAALERDGRRVGVRHAGRRPAGALASERAADGRRARRRPVRGGRDGSATTPTSETRSSTALVAHAEHAPLVVVAPRRPARRAQQPPGVRPPRRAWPLPPRAHGRAGAPRRHRAACARAAGLLLEPGLVDLVVRDVLDEPGRPAADVPRAAADLGRAGGPHPHRRRLRRRPAASAAPSAQSAEAVYAGIDARGPATKLRDLLLRLVTPVEDGAPARLRLSRRRHRRATPGTSASSSTSSMPGSSPPTATSSSSPTRPSPGRGPGSGSWLEDDVEGVRVLRHLNSAAAGWDDLGRPDSELYRGERLAGVVAWRERSDPELTAVEQAFVDRVGRRGSAPSCTRPRCRSQRERQTRAPPPPPRRRCRRASRSSPSPPPRLAVGQRDEADDQARIAEARQLSAEALDARPHDRALLLALEAVRRRGTTPRPRAPSSRTIGRSPRLAGVLRSDGPRSLDLDVAPDGERLAAIDDDRCAHPVRPRDRRGSRLPRDRGSDCTWPDLQPGRARGWRWRG